MEERTVIISSRELVDHTILSRKRNELEFKKDFLFKSGAKEGDLHLKAVQDELVVIEEKLKPVAEKLLVADLLTVIPARKEIGQFTQMINKYSRTELDAAVKSKSGEAYELMKKRAALVKGNFEKREDIARLTIMLNTLPRKEAESLLQVLEDGSGEDVDVSFLPKEKQQQLVNLTARLGRQCCVYAGSFSLDKKKVESAELRAADEVTRMLPGGRQVWVDALKAADFDANEKEIASILAKIQSKSAEKQTRELSEEESVYFDKLQGDYLSALQKRAQLAGTVDLSETAKLYKKESHKSSVEEY
jgi:hypothetical protein